ncbi:polyprenol phosphomannose-dependent alpha 1,6 mannosyltransferase MptB [Microbacteriaceae bacterium VKM Ac-2855]|nr:polyprenol phosphomannose-dependent alpha 1,6 mannosyltransferase MptB [Microbacteriaceae bacterium VKM Ac-2855]
MDTRQSTAYTASSRRARRFGDAVAPTALGALGSAAILFGSLGVGWLSQDSAVRGWPVIATLRASTTLRELCAAAIIGGGVLLVVAWLRMRTLAIAGGPGALRTILLAAVAWSAPLLVAVPVFSRDVFAYVAQGRLMTAGFDPYTNGIATLPGWFALGVDPLWADTPTPYGPLYLLIEEAAVRLGGWSTPDVSIALLRLVSVAGVVASAYYLLRIARMRGYSLPLTAWAVVANPLTALLFVAAAHNDAVMIAGILAGVHAAMTGRRVLAVLAVAAAIAIKPIAILALPVLALFWMRADAPLRERIRLWAVTGGAALAVVGALGVASGVGLGWIAAMTAPGSISHWYAPIGVFTMAVTAAFDATGSDPTIAVAVIKAMALLAAAGVVAALMLTRRPLDPMARMTGAFLAVVISSTAIHPWYALWVFPLAAITTRWRREHVHLAVYASLFFVFVTLAEPVDGGSGLGGLAARIATIVLVSLLGIALLAGYTNDEQVEGRALLRALPFRSEARAIATGGLVARSVRAVSRGGAAGG